MLLGNCYFSLRSTDKSPLSYIIGVSLRSKGLKDNKTIDSVPPFPPPKEVRRLYYII